MSETESSSLIRTAGGSASVPCRGSQRHAAMILFVSLSLFVTLSIGQLEILQQGSLRYWLVVAPAILLPLLDARAIAATLLGRSTLLLFFLLLAGCWQLFRGDVWAAIQLCLLVLGMAWISTPCARINVQDLARLYWALLLAGMVMMFYTQLNEYGIVPGYSLDDFGRWRVSFFPNIAYTAALSLSVFLVLTRTRATLRQRPLLFALAVYFLVFSQVRAALIAAVIYALVYWYFCKDQTARPGRMFWISLIVALGAPIAIFFSVNVLYMLQDNLLVSTVFLRGKTNLSTDDISYQLYRPWLWSAHLQLFLSSPAWMGWGSPDFYQAVLNDLRPPQATTGSESLPTRLLAVYGIPGIFATLYLVRRLRDAARADDRWACACFPAVFFLLVNWGGMFHPTDGIFVLLLLTITRGSAGFIDELGSRLGSTRRNLTLSSAAT